ncbi:MAG: PAS domain S-box protein [Cyanobacteria bacterium]|nr:PAS domain S-box protein [Cyanobacteriota bacterium]MDA0866658.1 PAS domain S-box protein [Cyanobacteriota bacterium]
MDLPAQSATTSVDCHPPRVSPDTSLLDAIALMSPGSRDSASIPAPWAPGQASQRSSYVLVMKDERLVGILTERDVVRLSAKGIDFADIFVAEVMTQPLLTIRASALQHPFAVLPLFRQHRIRHLPVLDDQDRLVGIVTPNSIRQTLQSADLFRLLRVEEVMVSQVITASPNANGLDLAKLMAQHRVSCVVIQQQGAASTDPCLIPVGIVTERDIVQCQASRLDLSAIEAQVVMSTPLVCLQPKDTLWAAHQTMSRMHVRRLVVTDEQGLLAGIVTQTSVLAALDPLEMQNTIVVLQKQVEKLHDERVQWFQNHTLQLEEQVAATEQRFQAIFNQTFQFMGLLELDGTLIEVNQTALDFGGLCREEVIDRPVWEARWWTISPETQAQLRAAIAQAAQGEFVRYEVDVLGVDRIVTIDFSLRPVWNEAGQVKLLIPEGRDISDLKQTERALRQSERRYANLAEVAPVGIFQTDAEGNCLYVNELWCQIAGMTPAAASGTGWVQGLYPDDRATVAAEWFRAAQGQQPFSLEYRFQNANGEVSWVLGKAVAEHDADGNLRGYIGTITDITERKQAEEALKTSETRLKEAQRIAQMGSWEVDLTTHDLIWSDETYRIFEIDPQQFGATYGAFLGAIHPEDRDWVDQAYITSVNSQSPYDITHRLLMADGRIKYVHERCQTFYGETGSPMRSIGTVQDVTTQVQLETDLHHYQHHLETLVASRTAELEESEARFRMMADTAPVLIWISGTDQLCTYFNQVWLAFTGRTLAQELGNGWTETLHPKDHDDCLKTYTTAFEARQPFQMEYRLRRFDGDYRWVVNIGRPRFLPNGEFAGYIGSCIDITDRRQMEQALFREKELAQITLHSIADAVITTDALGRVEYFNPVAEQLTGWDAAQARGKPLVAVFHIIHEITRQPVSNPVERALQDGAVIGLANHTVLVSRDGTEYSIEDSAAPIRDRDGQIIGAVMIFHDVTQSRELQQQLSWQASHDVLTDLPNRRYFEQQLLELLKDGQRQQQHHVLCYLDLDRFKVVNDTCGHIAGDELLRQVARLLKGNIRSADLLARLEDV